MAYIESTYPITLTSSGGTITLDSSIPVGEYDITGSATLLASYIITYTGTLNTNLKYVLNYDATIVLNGNTLTIFGLSLDDNQALQKGIITAKYDGSTWDTVFIPDFENDDIIETRHLIDDCVDKDKIAANVAGDGLGQNADGSLEVKVDSSTIEINTDTLRVKDSGITAAKIASAVAGAGLAGGAGTALSVNVDNSTIEINSDTLRLKDDGVTNAKLATMANDAVKTSDSSGNPQDTTLSSGEVIANIGSGIEAVSIDDLILESSNAKKELFVVEVSFEASEQGNNRIFIPYPFELRHIYFNVKKAIASTDDAHLTVDINGTQIVTSISPPLSSTYDFTASTPINSQGIAADCTLGDPANISNSAAYIDFATQKTTAGGKVILSVEIERI